MAHQTFEILFTFEILRVRHFDMASKEFQSIEIKIYLVNNRLTNNLNRH